MKITKFLNKTLFFASKTRCGPITLARKLTNVPKVKQKQSKVHVHICQKIQVTGPISVAQYMRDVLTSSLGGYYVYKDMLGNHGDFITSPEMSQMFGELIAIWIINEWKAMGMPADFRLVELGPGNGTLAEDILRTFHQLRTVFKEVNLSYHFVEISKKLQELQLKKLSVSQDEGYHKNGESGVSHHGVVLKWHRSIDHVPNDRPTVYLANEFFDALPIHKFVKTKDGWRELYVDLVPKSSQQLRLVILPESTVASRSLVKKDETREHVEVCAEGGAIAQSIAKRIEEQGGAVLIVDYGHCGEKEDTLRGFKDHKLHDVFEDIGNADLTADVDFSYLSDSIKPFNVRVSGPISQQEFLKNMGIEVRLMMLLKNCEDLMTRKKLVESYKMIMDESQMGERFKFLALTSHSRNDEAGPVAGFHDPSQDG